MAHEDVVSSTATDWPFSDPRPMLYAGAGASVLALILALPHGVWVPLRVLLLGMAILSTAAAVVTRPKAAAVLASAAVIALFSGWAMDGSWLQLLVRSNQVVPWEDDWDTARLVMHLLATVAVVATFLALVPWVCGKVFTYWEFTFSGHRVPDLSRAEERGRYAGWVLTRVFVSLFVVLHFIGILSAVMSVPVGGKESSWLAQQVWQRWQPYMQFMYLNNAYRFYSPEPGPAALIWFRIEYDDGSYRWIKLPTHGEHAPDPLAVEFTRRLSLGESINQVAPAGSVPDYIKQRRYVAGQTLGIPKHPELPLDYQFRPPAESCIRLLHEYAKHAAHAYPHDDPNIDVRGVKIYRVVHHMLEPRQMASAKIKPTEEWTYFPYFQGEFTKDGELKDPDDPFLYWLIPRFPWPKSWPPPNPLTDSTPGVMYLEAMEYDIYDYLDQHANLPAKEGRRQP